LTQFLAHRLLWIIGIAHGDVSYHNIMMKRDALVGVLNDFDLASIMDPGAKSLPQKGFRRTGTPLFMSVDLLSGEALSVGIPRLYRHDLESFAWVLLYASVCVKDGEENLDVEPFRHWISIGTSQLGKEKLAFLHKSKQLNLPDKQWLVSTFAIWGKIIIVRGYNGNMPGPEEDPELLGEVLRAWTIGKEEWENFSLPAVQGSSESAKTLLS
jgi:serine/threonine protein kinase